MMSYQPGDVVLIAFPYTGGAQTRMRPALVILDTGDADVLVARITTQLHQTPHDVTIADWRGAGLLAPSVVRLHKLAALEKALIRRRLGTLPPAERQLVAVLLRQTYGSW
jgi:mRNA interferase MazF